LLLPPALVWIGLFTGLSFTASRAGLAAAVLATICGAVLASIAERKRAMLAVGVLALVAGLGVAAAVGLERAYGRLLEASPYDISWGARARVYLHTLRLWLGYPVSGSGLGSFRDAFEPVQPDSVAGRWDHAHNDLFELLATGGLLSAAALAIGLFFLCRGFARILGEGIRTEDRAAGLGGLTLVVALLVHESLDYGLTMPANAFTAAVLLGAAAASSTRQYPSDISDEETTPPPRE
jgi:O-antigen ligase